MEGILQQFAAAVHHNVNVALAHVASTLGQSVVFPKVSPPILGFQAPLWAVAIAATTSKQGGFWQLTLRLSAPNQKLPHCLSWQGSWVGNGTAHVSRHRQSLMTPMIGRGRHACLLGRHCRSGDAPRPLMFGLILECESTKRLSTRTISASSILQAALLHAESRN